MAPAVLISCIIGRKDGRKGKKTVNFYFPAKVVGVDYSNKLCIFRAYFRMDVVVFASPDPILFIHGPLSVTFFLFW